MTQALTTTNGNGMSVMSRIEEFQKVAKIFAESGMFNDARGQAQCFVKILAGAELGLPPFTAMNAFHVIQGKVTMAASTIAARLKSSGKYDYKIVEKTGERCVIDFYANGEKVWQEVWDTKRAIKANVKNMDKFPDAMLFSRAISAGARAVAPDVVGQFYTPDEMGADVDADGNIIPPAVESQRRQTDPVEEYRDLLAMDSLTDQQVDRLHELSKHPSVQAALTRNTQTLAPVSDEARAAFSALVDRHNTLAELSKGAATMTEGQKKDFIAKVDALILDVNSALMLRSLPTVEHHDKVSVRFQRMTNSINAAIEYDKAAPLTDTREASASAQPA